ncbi:MAG: MFS transporter [Micromonosporaceae bacterium]
MLFSSRPAVVASSRSLAARLYGYAFLNDFILLYPVYALLFADVGLSTAEISSLFVIWCVAALVLEIPSGVWADTVSRRLLLIVAPLLTAIGYGLWTAAPSYPSFAIGFVLWGAQGALRSGALESLVYEELERLGAASRYPQIMGRATAIGTAAVVMAMGLAAPVIAAGGFVAVGVASVLACVAAAVVGHALPEHRVHTAPPAAGQGFGGYLSTLRHGVSEVRGRRVVRFAVLSIPAVAAMWGALDEYVPLLAVETGAAKEVVPWLNLIVYVGVTVGGLSVGLVSGFSAPKLAVLLAGAGAILAAGAVSGGWHGFVLLAVAFCGFQMTQVAAGARLQAAITGRARSTVTSLAGFAEGVATIGAFTLYAAGSVLASHGVLFACAGAGYGLVALWLGWAGGGTPTELVKPDALARKAPSAPAP